METKRRLAPRAVEMLLEDHHRVHELLKRFERADGDGQRARIARRALSEIKLHNAVEEQVFLPAMREALGEDFSIRFTMEEHHLEQLLIDELERLEPHHEVFEAKFLVLADNVRRHMRDEEDHILTLSEGVGLDMMRLGAAMAAYRQRAALRRSGR
jgi:hypothetical protein